MHKGFTLIEVLVVVALIALLISILMPTLGKARESARASVCAANLHRLGHAVVFYTNKFGVYPPVRMTKYWDSDKGTWETYKIKIRNSDFYRETPRWAWFFDYGVGPVISPGRFPDEEAFNGRPSAQWGMSSLQMDNDYFLCPSLKGEYERDIRNGAYGYNWQYLGNSMVTIDDKYARWPLKVDKVKSPVRTIVLADSRGANVPHGLHAYTMDPPRWAAEHNTRRFGPRSASLGPEVHSPVEMRHGKKGNVLFADGHVEKMHLKQLGYSLRENGLTDWEGGGGPGANNALWTGKGFDPCPDIR